MIVFLVTVVAAAVTLWCTSVFNRIKELVDETEDAWQRMTTHLRRRHEVVGELVREVTDVVDLEPELLEAVAHVTGTARETLQRAGPDHGVRVASRNQAALSEVLAQLKLTMTRYPDWHPRRRIQALLQEVTSAEAAAGEALRAYNDAAQTLIIQCEQVGWNLVSRAAGAPQAEIWADLARTSSGPALALREHPSTRD